MIELLGREHCDDANGETFHDSGWLLSWKWRGWCWWHHSNEAGGRAIQVAGLILEIWTTDGVHRPTPARHS